MAPPPKDSWDEDSEDSTPPSSPPVVARRGKFDDEEEDSDVVDTWDAEDSEVEREKAKKAEEVKAKAEAEKKANYKTSAQRRQEHIDRRKKEAENEDEDSDDDEEAEPDKKTRLRKEQKQSDLAHAVDMFGEIGVSDKRSTSKHITVADPTDSTNIIDLSTLSLFNPRTKDQFHKLRETLVPLIGSNYKAAHYSLFLQEFVKQLAKDLPSDQIKKAASGLTTLCNEKMKEEKAAEKGGKKSKAATKGKVTLNANKDFGNKADLSVYDDDGLDDGDFM